MCNQIPNLRAVALVASIGLGAPALSAFSNALVNVYTSSLVCCILTDLCLPGQRIVRLAPHRASPVGVQETLARGVLWPVRGGNVSFWPRACASRLPVPAMACMQHFRGVYARSDSAAIASSSTDADKLRAVADSCRSLSMRASACAVRSICSSVLAGRDPGDMRHVTGCSKHSRCQYNLMSRSLRLESRVVFSRLWGVPCQSLQHCRFKFGALLKQPMAIARIHRPF